MKEFIKTATKIGAFFITIDDNIMYAYNNDFVLVGANDFLPNCSIVNYTPLQILEKDAIKNITVNYDSNELVIETNFGKFKFTIMKNEDKNDLLKKIINLRTDNMYRIDAGILNKVYELTSVMKGLNVNIENDKIVCSTIDFESEIYLNVETKLEVPLNTILDFDPEVIDIYADDEHTILIGRYDNYSLFKLV
jgi:hypothetical protein